MDSLVSYSISNLRLRDVILATAAGHNPVPYVKTRLSKDLADQIGSERPPTTKYRMLLRHVVKFVRGIAEAGSKGFDPEYLNVNLISYYIYDLDNRSPVNKYPFAEDLAYVLVHGEEVAVISAIIILQSLNDRSVRLPERYPRMSGTDTDILGLVSRNEHADKVLWQVRRTVYRKIRSNPVAMKAMQKDFVDSNRPFNASRAALRFFGIFVPCHPKRS